jgi:hypothetical protein
MTKSAVWIMKYCVAYCSRKPNAKGPEQTAREPHEAWGKKKAGAYGLFYLHSIIRWYMHMYVYMYINEQPSTVTNISIRTSILQVIVLNEISFFYAPAT